MRNTVSTEHNAKIPQLRPELRRDEKEMDQVSVLDAPGTQAGQKLDTPSQGNEHMDGLNRSIHVQV